MKGRGIETSAPFSSCLIHRSVWKYGVLCDGGNQEQANKPRPLPEDEKVLRPGKYRSEEFKPSFSFRVEKGWKHVPLELPDDFVIARGKTAGLRFMTVEEAYKTTTTGTLEVVEAPKDMVGWFQHRPYLQTDKPEPVTVGGVKGKQFDVAVVEDLPKEYSGLCSMLLSSLCHNVIVRRCSEIRMVTPKTKVPRSSAFTSVTVT